MAFALLSGESDLRQVPEWSADTKDVCDNYEGWGDEKDNSNTYEGTGEAFAAKFRAAMQGYGKNLKPDSKVLVLAFDAATTGRLAMIENKEFRTSRYITNIQQWHESCRWLQVKDKGGHKYYYMGMAGIKDIAEALYGWNKAISYRLAENPECMQKYAKECFHVFRREKDSNGYDQSSDTESFITSIF